MVGVCVGACLKKVFLKHFLSYVYEYLPACIYAHAGLVWMKVGGGGRGRELELGL